MANNRVILTCRKCNDSKTILKYYPSTKWSIQSMWNYQETMKKLGSIEDWLEEHSHDFSGSLWGHEFFDIHFEVPEEKGAQ